MTMVSYYMKNLNWRLEKALRYDMETHWSSAALSIPSTRLGWHRWWKLDDVFYYIDYLHAKECLRCWTIVQDDPGRYNVQVLQEVLWVQCKMTYNYCLEHDLLDHYRSPGDWAHQLKTHWPDQAHWPEQFPLLGDEGETHVDVAPHWPEALKKQAVKNVILKRKKKNKVVRDPDHSKAVVEMSAQIKHSEED